MKCKNNPPLCICSKNICCNTCCLVPNLGLYENGSGDSHNFFDILSHNVPEYISKGKPVKVSKAPTSYRDAFKPKQLPDPSRRTKAPFSAVLIGDGKISHDTTHKIDFKPFSKSSKKNMREEVVIKKANLKCSTAKFVGESETNSSYVCPASIKFEPWKENKMLRKSNYPKLSLSRGDDFTLGTTYSTSYKRPRNFQKSVSCKPKLIKLEPPELLTTISQYKNDFKRLNVKRESGKKMEKYQPPDEPMECKTTYRLSYYPKPLAEKKSSKRQAVCRTSGMRAKKCLCTHNCKTHEKQKTTNCTLVSVS